MISFAGYDSTGTLSNIDAVPSGTTFTITNHGTERPIGLYVQTYSLIGEGETRDVVLGYDEETYDFITQTIDASGLYEGGYVYAMLTTGEPYAGEERPPYSNDRGWYWYYALEMAVYDEAENILPAGESVTITLPDGGLDTIYSIVAYYPVEGDMCTHCLNVFVGDDAVAAANPPSSEKPETSFTDVPEGVWYYEAVQWAADKGYIRGNGDGTFGPNNNMKRDEVFTILARIKGADVEGGTPWYQKAVDWAVENNVSYGNNPEDPITREELIVMLWRYEGRPDADISVLDGFSDSASIDDWADFPEAMAWAVQNGILNGDNNQLKPLNNTIRAEGAAILQRYCEKLGK